MANWPDIALPSEFEQSIRKGQIKRKFEDGTTLSRPKETRARRIFVISWNSITQTDLDLLTDFFVANIGTVFTWAHPLTSTEFSVRFEKDELPKAKWIGKQNNEDAFSLTGIILEED